MLNRPRIDGRRRLAAIVGATLVTFGGLVVVGTPAEAAPPNGCRDYKWRTQQAGSHITGNAWIVCPDEPDTALRVTIWRYLSPWVYEEVASGDGTATYYCDGRAFNRYRVTPSLGEFDILCG